MHRLYPALSGYFGEKGGDTEELLNRKAGLSPIFMNCLALIQFPRYTDSVLPQSRVAM